MNGKSQNALRFIWALSFSFAFHAATLYAMHRWFALGAPVQTLPPVLYARLELPQEMPEAPVLKDTMKEEPGTAPEAEDKPRPRTGRDPLAPPRGAKSEPPQDPASVELLYPPEALALGLEGEPVLLVEVDGNGRILSVSVGSSSGHPILDEAAVKKVWELGSLEGHRAKTVLFPVRFKLQ